MSIKRIPIGWLFGALLSCTIAILTFIWTPFDLLMEERLRMRPGLPGFDWWVDPPDVIRLKVYIFNVTNAERYLSGEDAKLKLEEIGPIVFREDLIHSDPVFNENSTLSYTVKRRAIWDPSLNSVDLNATLIFPNLPVLLTASLFWDTNFFVKKLLNYAFTMTKSKLFVKKTVYEILYNNTDPFLDVAHVTMPSIAVHKNIGLLPIIYPEYESRVTVFIGTKFGHQKFFLIDKFNGSIYLPGRGSKCKDDVVTSTNTIIYSQFVPKSRVLLYFNDLMCRVAPLTYQGDVYRQGIKAYNFSFREDGFDRIQPPEDDCYNSSPVLPDGLSDLSPCWYDFPVVGSAPHFLYGDPILKTYVDGLKPNATDYRAYAIVEPITGIALASKAIMQVNLNIKPLRNFNEMFTRVSNTIIPTFILESSNDHVPNYIITFIRIVHLLPTVGTILSTVVLVFGLYCMWKLQNVLFMKRKRKYTDVEISKRNYHLEPIILEEQQKLHSNNN